MTRTDLRVLWCLAAVTIAGCGDLALAPKSVPNSLLITPFDTLVTEGDQAKLTVTVLDEDGNVIPGPPSWALPKWLIVSDGAEAIDIRPDGSFTALGGGDLSLLVRVAGVEGRVDLRINPSDIELSAGAIYLTQAAQNLDGTVPLIAGRPAFLRVFPVGDELSFFEPRARATFYQDGEVVHSAALNAVLEKIVTEPEEETLDRSHNATIPGSVIQPGVRMVVELDPDGIVPIAPGSQLRIPAEGTMRLNVVEMPLYHQTIVPVVQTLNSNSQAIIDWAEGKTAEDPFFRFLRTVLPVNDMKVTIHEPFYTSADLRTEQGWNRWIAEIRTMWEMEGRRGYYYGASVLPPGSAYGGYGYLQTPVSVGVNRIQTYTHEIGHNMSLRHIDCGGPAGPDPNYPHNPASIGIYGFDVERQGIIHPRQFVDLMTYCDPTWISDYSLNRALNRRLAVESAAAREAWEAIPEESTLMLWGHMGDDGELLMEPAFLVESRPSVPATGGPYRLEGFAEGGDLRFGFDFTPEPLEFGGGQFHFTVPYDPDRDGRLERVVLSGPEGEFILGPSSTSPMAIIINRSSGQVRAILRDWDGQASIAVGDTDIMVSDGLPWSAR